MKIKDKHINITIENNLFSKNKEPSNNQPVGKMGYGGGGIGGEAFRSAPTIIPPSYPQPNNNEPAFLNEYRMAMMMKNLYGDRPRIENNNTNNDNYDSDDDYDNPTIEFLDENNNVINENVQAQAQEGEDGDIEPQAPVSSNSFTYRRKTYERVFNEDGDYIGSPAEEVQNRNVREKIIEQWMDAVEKNKRFNFPKTETLVRYGLMRNLKGIILKNG